MNELIQAIASISTALHQDRVEQIAVAVERFDTPTNFNPKSAPMLFGSNAELIAAMQRAWLTAPTITGREIAFGLRTAVLTASIEGAAEKIDLVWTGPRTGLIPTRNTEQAIREVIDGASQNLFIVSYVFYNATSIVESLNQSIDRGVVVRILLESSKDHGGAIAGDSIRAMHTAVPKAELFVWNPIEKSMTAGSLTAAVHAKCAIADNRLAFVTSANLTSAAMERNMELGILIRGGVTPERLQSHLNALVLTGTIVAWN